MTQPKKMRSRIYGSYSQMTIPLPSGRKLININLRKADEDGRIEPVMSVTSLKGHRVAVISSEEFIHMKDLAARIRSFCYLWEDKAEQNLCRSVK